jgi:hypothetical protein
MKKKVWWNCRIKTMLQNFFLKKTFPAKRSSLFCSFVSDEEKSFGCIVTLRQSYNPFFTGKLSRGKRSSLLCFFVSNEEKKVWWHHHQDFLLFLSVVGGHFRLWRRRRRRRRPDGKFEKHFTSGTDG